MAIPRQRPASSGGPLNRENFSSSSQVPSFFWAGERGGGSEDREVEAMMRSRVEEEEERPEISWQVERELERGESDQ